MRAAGGFLRLEDLKRNQPEWWTGHDRLSRLHGGSVSLPNNAWNGLYRLGIMSRFDLGKMGHNSRLTFTRMPKRQAGIRSPLAIRG